LACSEQFSFPAIGYSEKGFIGGKYMVANIPVYLYKNNPKKSWHAESGNCGELEYINIIQGETESEILNFHLFLDDSTPLDLTEKTATFYFTKPDGESIFLQADIPQESAANGIALVTLTAQCTAVSGLTKNGVVRVSDKDNRVLKFPVPNLYIASSDCENAVESTSEFHALDIALNSVSESLTAAEAAAENAQSVLDSDRQTLEQINTALADVSTATQAANTAAENAASCAQAASDAASAANTAANTADTAAQHAETAATSATEAAANIPQIESGTWTPTFYGSETAGNPTYDYHIGTYVKIGYLVVCNILLKLKSVGNASGYVCVSGLPFATQNTGLNVATNKLTLSGLSLSSGNIAGCVYLPSNKNYFMFYKESTAGTGASGVMTVSEITDTFGIVGTFVYISDS
jgi:hypothetical protein